MKKYKVGIVGCGAILPRHIEAIVANKKNFELVAVCDIDKERMEKASKENKVPGFTDFNKMLKEMKGKMNFVSIATPNSLHFPQAIAALEAGNDVVIEKPIDFKNRRIHEIGYTAERLGRKAYAVLQVRYNPTVQMVREALEKKIFGDLRIIDFIQRWQRPLSYFEGWRGSDSVGGGTLYECGIHYLDILQYLFGLPDVKSGAAFSHKHKHVDIEDTVHAIVKYPSGASGAVEVTIATEPSNLECSISILGSEGYVKLGGNALDVVEEAKFLSEASEKKWKKLQEKHGESLTPNSYGTHQGSCPNHPTLYAEIAAGRGIPVQEAAKSVKYIQDIYLADSIEY